LPIPISIQTAGQIVQLDELYVSATDNTSSHWYIVAKRCTAYLRPYTYPLTPMVKRVPAALGLYWVYKPLQAALQCSVCAVSQIE